MSSVRWRSWLGGAVVFFLLYGGVNLIGAVWVPITQISGGAGAHDLVLNWNYDAYLAGGRSTIDSLRTDNPKLNTLLVSSKVAFNSQMMVYSILVLSITWFAIRRHQAWAIWAVTIAAVAQIPYYVVITNMYVDQGVSDHSFYLHLPFYVFLLVRNLIFLAVIGFVLAMIGRWLEARKESSASPSGGLQSKPQQ